jgi:hypothetical protein
MKRDISLADSLRACAFLFRAKLEAIDTEALASPLERRLTTRAIREY